MKFYWRLQLEIDHVVADEYYEWTNRGQRNFIGTENKDGKEHGLETWWQPNGQKGSETTYKDDEVNFLKGMGRKWQTGVTPLRLPHDAASVSNPIDLIPPRGITNAQMVL